MNDWQAVTKRIPGALGGKWCWEAFGPDGVTGVEVGLGAGRTVILTCAEHEPHGEWVHASVSRPDRLPSYHDLVGLHKSVWPDGFAYQVFASTERHVNIHSRALHLWGRLDGANVLPDFGEHGTI